MTSATVIDEIYVVDTNALIWYLTNDPRLSRRAADIFDAAEKGETRLYISAIVIAELYFANKKWRLFTDFSQIYLDLRAKAYIRLVPLLADEVLEFDRDSAIPEMHDRIIVGLARRLNAALLTSDSVIRASQLVTVLW